MSLLQKVKNGMGSPDWNMSMVDTHLRKLLWVYCPGHAEVKRNGRADRLSGKATLPSGLLLGSSEVLRSLRHYLRIQSQGHHTTVRLQQRGVLFLQRTKQSHRRSDEHWKPFKEETLGKLLRDRVERMCAFPSA